jgi:hypothetical protein
MAAAREAGEKESLMALELVYKSAHEEKQEALRAAREVADADKAAAVLAAAEAAAAAAAASAAADSHEALGGLAAAQAAAAQENGAWNQMRPYLEALTSNG